MQKAEAERSVFRPVLGGIPLGTVSFFQAQYQCGQILAGLL